MSIWPGGAWARARAEGDAEVVLVGDSITHGQAVTDYGSRSYAQLLRSLVRSYGDGGDGFTPHFTGSDGGGTAAGTGTNADAFVAEVPNGQVRTISGTVRWTWPKVTGTEVAVYFRRLTTDGTARWRVDGGAWQTVVCTGTAGYIRAEGEPLSDGPHTVDVEAVSGTVGVAGTEGWRAGGCRLHLMGLGGRSSGGNAFWTAQGEAVASFRAATVGRWAPHLLIVNLGVNDSNSANTTAAQYELNIAGLITTALAARADCDVVLVANHLGKFNNNGYDAMRTALVTLAGVHGAIVVDVDTWARTPLAGGALKTRTAADPTGTSWGDWSTWGWWSNGTDAVHPGDTGHHVLAHVLGLVLAVEDPVAVTVYEEIETGGVVL